MVLAVVIIAGRQRGNEDSRTSRGSGGGDGSTCKGGEGLWPFSSTGDPPALHELLADALVAGTRQQQPRPHNVGCLRLAHGP